MLVRLPTSVLFLFEEESYVQILITQIEKWKEREEDKIQNKRSILH